DLCCSGVPARGQHGRRFRPLAEMVLVAVAAVVPSGHLAVVRDPARRRPGTASPALRPGPVRRALVGPASAAGVLSQRPAERAAVGPGLAPGAAAGTAGDPGPGLRLAGPAPPRRCCPGGRAQPAALHPARRAGAGAAGGPWRAGGAAARRAPGGQPVARGYPRPVAAVLPLRPGRDAAAAVPAHRAPAPARLGTGRGERRAGGSSAAAVAAAAVAGGAAAGAGLPAAAADPAADRRHAAGAGAAPRLSRGLLRPRADRPGGAADAAGRALRPAPGV